MDCEKMMPILLAVTPESFPLENAPPYTPVWLCYRTGSDGRLYRTGEAERIHGGILAAGGENLPVSVKTERFCPPFLRECQARQAEGVLLNWTGPVTEHRKRLASSLSDALQKAGLSLYVPQEYGNCCQSAFVLVSASCREGILRQQMEDAAAQYGAHRVVMVYEPLREDYALPCPGKAGQYLSKSQFSALKDRYSPAVHFSEELLASYFTYEQDGRTHLTLFDDETAFRRKRTLAEELHLAGLLAPWQAVCRKNDKNRT